MMPNRHDPQSEPLNHWLDQLVSGQTRIDAPEGIDPDLANLREAANRFHAQARREDEGDPTMTSFLPRWNDLRSAGAPALPVARSVSPPRSTIRPVRAYPPRPWLRFANFAATLVLLIALGAGIWRVGGEWLPGGDDPATIPFSGAALQSATPETAQQIAARHCQANPEVYNRDELQGLQVSDFPTRSYEAVGEVDQDKARAVRKAMDDYFWCAQAMVETESQVVSQAQRDVSESHYSPEFRYFEIYPAREARMLAAMCVTRSQLVVQGIPYAPNLSTPPAFPTPEAGATPPAVYIPNNEFADEVAVYQLADGRYAYLDGYVTPESWNDPAGFPDGEYLWFTAVVEIDGYYYIDEQFTVEPVGQDMDVSRYLDQPTEPCATPVSTPAA